MMGRIFTHGSLPFYLYDNFDILKWICPQFD